ncbi:hypothetical protein Igag_1083 [Ignisphaera aggregans DSM 17230]|uniref:Uncharacterized protein n=1 Tax=Ignisphaera aggregans (strain DSM 17230 / JCM 13409 / AQ1.S1) TaxID=583356 RepID=E0SNV0_IGNAA|nr:hypothetical protein Igag_1083 [Ignisphaera aggregans DSM 17230]
MVLMLIVFLYIFSFFSGGFVLFLGFFAQYFNSMAIGTFIFASIVIICIAILIARIISSARSRSYDYYYDYMGRWTREQIRDRIRGIRYGGWGTAIFLLMLFIAILGVVYNATIVTPGGARYLMDNYVVFIDRPIEVSMTRIIPQETAFAYATSFLTLPTHRIYIEESYEYYINGSIIYNWIIEPSGIWNEIFRDAYGVVLVNGSIYPPHVVFINRSLYWSLHRTRITPLYIDTLLRQLKARALALQPLIDDNIEVYIDGKIYVLIPIKTWVKGFTYSIPMLYGYAIIEENGDIHIVEAKELMQHPLARRIFESYEIPIIPDDLAREWIEILRWYAGFWEVVLQRQTFEIRDVGYIKQPYLLFDSNRNLYWVFTVEPAGEGYAIKYIIYVDAKTIEPKILVYRPEKTLMGASRIASYVQKAHPTLDWSKFMLTEPIPIISNETLYWKVSIITNDGRGVLYIDFVDASTGNVYTLQVLERLTVTEFDMYIKTFRLPVEGATAIESIKRLQQEVKELIESLQRILEELQRLEKEITNRTI